MKVDGLEKDKVERGKIINRLHFLMGATLPRLPEDYVELCNKAFDKYKEIRK